MKNLFVLVVCLLTLVACKTDVKKQNQYEEDVEVRDPQLITNKEKKKMLTTAEAIAHANGFEHWNKVKEIIFTFNVDRDTVHSERSWNWKPKENLVTMTSATDTITYNRTQIDSTNQKADEGFINDKYWLLAPFNLVWDSASFTSQHQVKAVAPISNKEMQKLTIVYKNEGGYTPGDAYDFYFEGDFIIKEWVFRQKNTAEPSLITSWENYNTYNGIKIAKTHKRNEGDWTLHFTNIEIITE
ncbi:hypothetical protein [Aquimarina mytili]|uniref:Selenophosphate synthetase n=1 Tax=Aquimarina mytili TaxID=874423 RepID=A0A936ZY90_9FLAO|nr:hypothetical protein [Aquimarina mytili]MBL0683341.1 hypothetical protein [Aquimarina mytili]